MGLILVVDDDPNTLELLAILFQKENYQVIKTVSGGEAIVLARKHKPDLVILDLMMPDIDGMTVCQMIRKDPEISHTPVVILTAAHSIDKKLESFDRGIDAYLTKPVHPDELRAQVRVLINRFRRSPQRQLTQESSQVIAVISASDKADPSTIALNLAASAVESCKDTVLVELVPGSSGISDLAGIPQLSLQQNRPCASAQDLSGENLQELLLTHRSGLKILPFERIARAAGCPDTLTLNPGQIQNIIRTLSQEFRCIFLDLGRGFNNQVQAAQSYIDDYIVVMRAESLSLPESSREARLLAEKGVSWDHIFIALVAIDPWPNYLTIEKSKQILQANGIENNVLLYMPPSRQMMNTDANQHNPVVLLLPDDQPLDQSFKEAMRRLVKKM